MTDRPDPARDFKAASDRFQQAIAAAAEKTTEAEATLSAAIEDYNRAVDTYNAHAEQYNREHGLTEDDDEAETLRYLVRNGDTATLEAKPSWPDERDGALAELTAELESANANAAEIADQRTAYRKEIMRLRARVRELEGAQAADDTTRVDAPRHTDDTSDAERLAQIHDRNRRLAAVPWELHDGDHGPACIPCELVRAVGDVSWLLELVNEQQREAFATALDTGPAVWCWNRHPDHPLHCGRFAGHEGPHIRGERSWEDVAPQQPEDGDRG